MKLLPPIQTLQVCGGYTESAIVSEEWKNHQALLSGISSAILLGGYAGVIGVLVGEVFHHPRLGALYGIQVGALAGLMIGSRFTQSNLKDIKAGTTYYYPQVD